MQRSSNDIRGQFIRFFQERGHSIVPSSSLLPAGDPTLLFANAGMNQFKDFFLGTAAPQAPRVANSQKCIRAGGKHNDLEDVGHDTFHHTFFEMLGNWSFGDYFKEEAIRWAWELLTEVWRLPTERLYATVFAGDEAEGLPADDEAAELWRTVTDIDPAHVRAFDQKDNFWEMGETGPCGPCSEIHIDLGSECCDGRGHPGAGCAVNVSGCGRFIELWNLVFMQFNRGVDTNGTGGKLAPLPANHVDTGMGFERICRVLQGAKSNYATDLFVPIIKKIETLTPERYGSESGPDDRFNVLGEERLSDVAFRVAADHARALTFAIADGVIPSNEGRGYVLRRILRRAARYGRQYLKIDGPFLHKLVATIAELMGEAFPEVRQRKDYVVQTITAEEESFGRTLDRGIDLFEKQADKLRETGKRELPGEVAFDLYATYGFPVDLTQIMASERGIEVDTAGFERAMAEHAEVSRGAGERFKVDAIVGLPATDDSAKYDTHGRDARATLQAKVLGWVQDNQFITEGALSEGDEAAVVLDRTNFYAEQGGQVGDTGVLELDGGSPQDSTQRSFVVANALPAGDCVLHVGRMQRGKLTAGDEVLAKVGPARLDTMRNHTATHLLNWALAKVLGDHVNQAGSVVAPDRLRFDFTHNQAVTHEQLGEVERLVNERIRQDLPVEPRIMPLAEAKKIPGVRAVFGEKYPDPVRVISTGSTAVSAVVAPHTGETPVVPRTVPHSAEFCGGTHCERTGQIGLFKIVSEESVAKGVRRITALTGAEAVRHVQALDEAVRSVAGLLRAQPAELPERVAAMQKEIKQLRRSRAAGGGEKFSPDFELDSPAGKVLIGRVGESDPAAMRRLCDVQRQRGAAAVFLGGLADEKVTLVAMVSDELASGGKITAGQWVQAVAPVVGGRGGGKPTLAQAGGRQADKLPQAMQAAADWARQRLS